MKKVTIIVPIYNVEKYLDKCINSIINQTYKNLEIILVNDGSTDKSGEIANKFAGKDNRIKVIHQKNAGVSSARNAGIDAATGEYLCFVDSDDYADERLVELILDENYDLSVGGLYIDDNDFSPPDYTLVGPDRSYIAKNMLLRPYIVHSIYSKIFRTSIVNRYHIHFDINCNHGEDLLFVLAYLRHSSMTRFLSRPLYYYNTVEGGLMSRESRSYSKKVYLFNQMGYYFRDASIGLRMVLMLIYARWTLSTIKNNFARRLK